MFRVSGLGDLGLGLLYGIPINSLAQISKPKETKVETFRIDYLIRAPKVEKLSLQPGGLKRIQPRGPRFRISGSRFGILGFEVQGFEFRVSGLGFRVSGLGFRVSGLGFRV